MTPHPARVEAFLVTSDEGSYREYSPVAWFATRDECDRYAVEHPPTQYHDLMLYALRDDGSIEHLDSYRHVPEPYRGPLVRARLNVAAQPDYARCAIHRAPIECWTPRPDRELTEDYPVRVVANGYIAPPDASFMACRCGPWQEIEGSPERVAELVAKFPFGVSQT